MRNHVGVQPCRPGSPREATVTRDITATLRVVVADDERPDLTFLDFQMPEVDGLGVVRLLRKDRLPLVAFVTAYDEYAVQAFAGAPNVRVSSG